MSGPISNGGAPTGPVPTDQELMLWVDGELDEARAAEVEAFVRRDARVRAVVSALSEGGAMLAYGALEDAGARGADSIVDRVMATVEADAAERGDVVRLPRKRRMTLAVGVGAAISLAAAVLLFVGSQRAWRLSPLTDGRVTGALVAEGPTSPELPGAFIDVVDFGARSGTIFYVPSEGDSTTAVVWLTEDESSPPTGESP